MMSDKPIESGLYECGDLHEKLSDEPVVLAWLAEKAKRPPIEGDRTKLSDEVQPDVTCTRPLWLERK
jgi:hypothetical protein